MSKTDVRSRDRYDCQPGGFESEILKLRPALHAFASRFCRSRQEIDDLVQDTLLKALRFRDRFQSGTSLKSWLFTIMRNHFYSEFHVRKREPVTAYQLLDLLTPSLPDQEWVVCQHEVSKAIDRLPRQQRLALLQVCAGTSYDEAASSLGCEVGTIKSRVSRARHRLHAEFGDMFGGNGFEHVMMG